MQLNQSIGEYQILGTIQANQYPQVYQAKNRNDGQNYTIKITDSQYSQLCEHEKEILKKFVSPNIIKFIDQKVDQQYSLTILEHCDKTLEDFWKQNNQQFSEGLALDIFKEILDGLENLEQQNIVHADLCMKNIYISQCHYKIANFEYAHFNQRFLIKSSHSCNAPELYTPVNLTSKADIFSLGCILFAMIFGYNPFNYESSNDYLVQIQKSQLLINEQIAQSLSPFIIQLIQRMVQYNPTQRPGIYEIKQELLNNMGKQEPYNNLLITQTPQLNPELWGMIENNIFETQDFTKEFVESVSKKALFYFEVAEKFGGKEFYNWKKTMYPRFMMYKKSYYELINFSKEVKQKCKSPDFVLQLEKNDKTIFKLKGVLDQVLQMLKKENEYKYQINNWEKELNTDFTPLFNNNYQKALQFLIGYFQLSQIPFSKQQKQTQNLKDMLILYIQVQLCQTYNPYHDDKLNKTEDLQKLADQTIEFLFQKAGYEK
ncbi:unnamed protein product [Paramecium pentaurelia]|uniref:Protein kinase domain-containing protein n=1 Tax=Paramecium pentaurelia TaxID=43138 RepID=A0A8S1T6X0_9CILI|nr:unnamed protein product [Paramecium pentaurelia]